MYNIVIKQQALLMTQSKLGQASKFGKPLGFSPTANVGNQPTKPQQVVQPKFNPATFKTQHKG